MLMAENCLCTPFSEKGPDDKKETNYLSETGGICH
jgi:hypothetical protein